MIAPSTMPSARAGVLQGLEQAMRRIDVSPERMKDETGISIDDFAPLDKWVGFDVIGRVLEYCCKEGDSPHFPLLLSSSQDSSFLGSLGLLFGTARNIAEFLDDFRRFIQTHAHGITCLATSYRQQISLEVIVDVPQIPTAHRRHCILLALGQFALMLRTLTNDPTVIKGVVLRRKCPVQHRPYQHYFRTNVQFGGEQDALVLDADTLSRPISLSSPELHALARQQLAQMIRRTDQKGLASEVRALIFALLPTQECDLKRIAKFYGCEKRTLQRHLKTECGVSFQTLLDEVRFELACQYLSESSMQITQIAFAVGFSDISNFARAFRKHVGISAGQWRAAYWKISSPAA